jgi:hypothetical protein
VSKTRHESYRAWGDYRKQRELTKDFINWKSEAQGELNDMTGPSAYIIINDWLIEGNDAEYQEIVGSEYFDSEDDAWENLALIAESYDIVLEGDETSFELPRLHNIEKQTFYIQELNHG